LKYEIICGDSREKLKSFKEGHFNLIVTSPPYADARKKQYDSIDTGSFAEFMLSFHNEFWRVLSNDGSFVINIKDKVIDGVRDRYVWHTIEVLSNKGWQCIDDYIWIKNGMPGYWPNRLRDGWEYCFHLTKNKKFVMYQEAVKKPIGDWAKKRLERLAGEDLKRHTSNTKSGFGRDLRKWVGKDKVLPDNVLKNEEDSETVNVLEIANVGTNRGHPAVFPVGLPEFFIKLFTKEEDHVLDPFAGSGSTGVAALKLNRHVTLIDTKPEYVELMEERLAKVN
jgi:site-specific DNA-methyltransferase (adenine-specific)/site-specific DNA-methyltransferase (cytosine-N4-specific)